MEYLFEEIFCLKAGPRRDYPPVDIYEGRDEIVFMIDLPGVDVNDVLVKVYRNLFIIEGLKREPVNERSGIYICMEREFDSFRRILPIPVPVDPSGGRATYSGGVLKVTLPKPKDRVYKIKIEKE